MINPLEKGVVMPEFWIEVKEINDGVFEARIEEIPVKAEGLSPFSAVGRLLRKINSVQTWLNNMDLVEYNETSNDYMNNLKRRVDKFTLQR